jgi:hypothetical protein
MSQFKYFSSPILHLTICTLHGVLRSGVGECHFFKGYKYETWTSDKYFWGNKSLNLQTYYSSKNLDNLKYTSVLVLILRLNNSDLN